MFSGEGGEGGNEEAAHFSDVVHGDLDQSVAAVAEHIGDAAEPWVDEQGFWIEVVAGRSAASCKCCTLSKGQRTRSRGEGAPQGIAIVFVQFQLDDLFVGKVSERGPVHRHWSALFEGREFGASRHPHDDGVAKEKHIALPCEHWRRFWTGCPPRSGEMPAHSSARSQSWPIGKSVFDDHPDTPGRTPARVRVGPWADDFHPVFGQDGRQAIQLKFYFSMRR